VPKLWTETIDEHRTAVRDAALDATAALVAEHGLVGVTMSAIAERAGIGRATLYKYFPDAQTILTAWHERQIERHLDRLDAVARRPGGPGERLRAVLEAYAALRHQARGHQAGDLAGLLHAAPHARQAHRRLHRFVTELLTDAARAGDVRADVDPGELAAYCLHALGAAADLPARAAVHRLVEVTLAGLRRQGRRPRPRSTGARAA
jgi:AcrR family transcriptional regulator